MTLNFMIFNVDLLKFKDLVTFSLCQRTPAFLTLFMVYYNGFFNVLIHLPKVKPDECLPRDKKVALQKGI